MKIYNVITCTEVEYVQIRAVVRTDVVYFPHFLLLSVKCSSCQTRCCLFSALLAFFVKRA
jgi:hypothetical protein